METLAEKRQKATMESYKDASISHGTHREQDLLPAFLVALDELKGRQRVIELLGELKSAGSRLGCFIHHKTLAWNPGDSAMHAYGALGFYGTFEDYYLQTEQCPEDLQAIMQALEEIAPCGYYFGAHEGDGSDFGFWKTEEQAFLDSIESNLEGFEHVAVGPCPGCGTCGLDESDGMESEAYQLAQEGDSFSTSSCDSCGTHLAGYRGPAHASRVVEKGSQSLGDPGYVHLDICSDCEAFHANGTLPGGE